MLDTTMLDTALLAVDLDTILQIGVFLFIIISTLAGQLFGRSNQRRQQPRPQPTAKPNKEQAEGMARDDFFRRNAGDVRAELEPVRAEVIEARRVEPLVPRESVSEHVERHISSGGIRTKSSPSAVELADERMESHLHEAFDHSLGKLQAERGLASMSPSITGTDFHAAPPVEQRQASDVADRVVEMMRNPDDLAAAIVLNEVLKRPDYGWDG